MAKKADKKIDKKAKDKSDEVKKLYGFMDRDDMLKKLSKHLDDKRLIHSIGVEYTAACLAMRWGEDVTRARVAGLLHDCGKCIPKDEKLELAHKWKLPVNGSEAENPDLLHGKLGAYLAHKKYDVDDEKIMSAIAYHTTGHPNMTLLEKIIFVADYIEPNRRIIKDLPEIREEAFTDLDKCVVHILRNTLEYLKVKDVVIDEMTERTYDYYINA